MIVTVFAFLFALLVALAIVPILDRIARRVGLVDHPDNNRKLHKSAIPMVGGLALFFAATLSIAVSFYVGNVYGEWFESLTGAISKLIPIDWMAANVQLRPADWYELVGLLAGSSLLLVVGLLDDRFGIRGRQKLMGQFLAVTVLIAFGFKFDFVNVAGMKIQFGIFSVLVIYAWVIAATNSVNLLDGADGIASTIGIVMSLAICLMSLSLGRIVDAVVAVAVAGALLGFLRFNFPPAKAYLGDSGSMLIGFVLSALAIRCMFKQNSLYAFFAPVALLAIPFIDTAAAIIRRRLTGRSIFAVDRGHLHHSLMKRGYSPRISLLWVALLCTTTAAGAVLSLLYHQSEYALVSIGLVLVVMIACKIFGVAEYQLVSRKATSLAKSFFHMAANNAPDVLQSSVHVQGNRDWKVIWKLLCDFADEHRINQLTLDLNAPWMHESFHATQRRSDVKRGENQEWFSQIPLVIQGRSFGRIEILGSHSLGCNHHETIADLLKLTMEIERSLADPVLTSIVLQEPNSGTTETAGTSSV